MSRQPISKKLRFEVFKRDGFACQYCGAKAPEAVLHVDHIKPVSKGGTNDLLNLVAACSACNAGKGVRLLDDRSSMERQRAQLEELQARRDQLEMMVAWRDELENTKSDSVDLVADKVCERGSFYPNENGRAHIRKWLSRYSFEEVLAAVDVAFDEYMEWRGDHPVEKAWEKAFSKIPGICSIKRQSADKPWFPRLFYIQGILRKRFRDRRGLYVEALDEMIIEWGATVEELEAVAKKAGDWSDFNDRIKAIIQGRDPEPVDY